MREFWHRFLTDRRWFVGTMIFVSFFVIFFWWLINPQGFITTVNEFIQILLSIAKVVLTFVIIILGMRVILGYRPWWIGGGRRNNGGHH